MAESDSGHRWTAECDAAFVVALREELRAADIFQDASAETVANDLDLEVHRRRMVDPAGTSLEILTLLIDDQGPEHAAIATTKFLQRVQAKLLVLLGISGRISDDCRLGDVVLADRCDNSYYRAKKKDQRVLPGGKEWPLDALARRLYSSLDAARPYYSYDGIDSAQAAELRAARLIRDSPATVYGPVCATPFLVDDPEFADWLKNSRNRNILATDMESAAVVQAAHECGVRNGRVLVIRGVSDPADGNKAALDAIGAGVMRRIAMRNAAQLASHCVSRLLAFSGSTVSLREVGSDGPRSDGSASAYASSVELVRSIADKVDAGVSEKDVCTWGQAQRAKSPTTGRQIADLAAGAYAQEIDRQGHQTSAVLALLPPTAIDFLVASYIMDCLVASEVTSRTIEVLSNVYPQRINRFCKAFLEILPDEKRLVDTLVQSYQGKSSRRGKSESQTRERAKAHICYLLGRLRTPQQRSRAVEALLKWRSSLAGYPKSESSPAQKEFRLERAFGALESPEKRLLLRTICISLILLGHPGEAEAYVRACLRSKEFDSLNRGFHLEYYGDIDYDPRESMNNTDPVFVPSARTFETLLAKLGNSYRSGRSYPLRDVELQTLLSLCQHRHARQALEESQRQRIAALLAEFSDEKLSGVRLLQAYSSMLRDHFAIERFRRVDLLRKLYELKKLPRSGWNDCDEEHQRSTPHPESVLSHTAGGMLLIQFCLPDRLSKEDREKIGEEAARAYSKDEISRIFLAHDLAEAYTGDLTPKQRNDVTKAKERRVNSHIDLFGTWPGFHHFGMFRSWEEFEKGSSVNGRIAKEIDALENLLQLVIETETPGVEISDYEYWRADLIQRIETPMSKRILEILLEPLLGR